MRAAKIVQEPWEGWDDLPFDAGRTAFSDPQRLADIWTTPWHQIENLELIPGVPLRADAWTMPRHWASGGAQRSAFCRSVDFTSALPATWSRTDAASEEALRRLKRLAVIMLLQTGRIGRSITTLPKPSTWIKELRAICRCARLALEAPVESRRPSNCPDGRNIFGDLSPDSFERIRAEGSSINAFVGQINALYRSGHFDDWPSADVAGRPIASEPFQPLSNTAVGAIGSAALWFNEVGPDLLDCFEQLRAERKTKSGQVRWNLVLEHRRQWLAEWSGEKLKSSMSLPYQIKIRSGDGSGNSNETLTTWPPRSPNGVRSLVSTLQAANMIVLLLSTGARDGELTELRRDCLDIFAGVDVATGFAFKSSAMPGGDQRSWPLPSHAVRAIRLQQRLGAIMAPKSTALWVPFYRQENAAVLSTAAYLSRFCRTVSTSCGRTLAQQVEGNVHPHRFRKTVARLAALSLVGANQVLQEVLGHRNPEMTLNYILSDPELQEEMHEIAVEANIALATEALRDKDAAGGAAKAILELAERMVPRLADEEMAASTVGLAAEILSEGGGAVMLVRPNVLCTKTFNQYGPCTKGGGAADIGSCQIDCTHRLELSAGTKDHYDAVQQIMNEMHYAGDHMRVWWSAQLRYHCDALIALGQTPSACALSALAEDFRPRSVGSASV